MSINLKPSPLLTDLDLTVDIFSESSFYIEKNFDFVSELVNDRGESIAIIFKGKNLTNYIDFISNKVLKVDNISSQFTGITSVSEGNKIVGLSTFKLTNLNNDLLSVTIDQSNIQSTSGQELTIFKNYHDFATGEPVDYSYTESPIEISPVVVGSSSTTILPSILYAIKVSDSRFQVAVSESDAFSGIGVTFVGIGTTTSTHKFSSRNGSGRSIIQIDSIIQSPLSYTGFNLGVSTSIGISTTLIPVSGISSIKESDFVSVNEEIMKIDSIVGTGSSYIVVQRGQMGTVSAAHTSGDTFKLYSGNYSIKNGNIYFSNPPFKGSSFRGRVFYKRKYDRNYILDDISNQFIGIGKTFNLSFNGSDVGLTTSTVSGLPYGILLVNSVFQEPIENYTLTSNAGISTLIFSGNDVSSLPNAGKILSFDYSQGSGYQPRVAAAATVSVSVAGTISNVYLTGSGSGYLTPPTVSIASTVGSGASITALVGTGNSVGFITGFVITNPGSGYTTTSVPIVEVDEPYGYTGIPLVYLSGSGSGQGATIDLVVGAGGSMINVDLSNIGYGYNNGDVLTVSGLGTQSGYSPFTLTVSQTYNDNFSFWTFGKLTNTQLLPDVADGFRKTFELREPTTNDQIDFELNSTDTRLDFRDNFLVFVNNVLQDPDSYTIFGPYLTFREVPPANSKISILIYLASNEDSKVRIVEQSVKVGDTLQIQSDDNNLLQDERFVFDVYSKSEVKTPTYIFDGINSDINYFRPVFWRKQTIDLVVSGVNVSKSRSLYEVSMRPSSLIIAGVGTTSTTIYVDNLNSFVVDGVQEDSLQVELIENNELNQAKAVSVVSTSSTVSSITVVDGGSRYSQSSPPRVTISNKEIAKDSIGLTWNKYDIQNTVTYNKSVYDDGKIVSVGNSQSIRYSNNLVTFVAGSVGVGSTNLRSVSYGSSIWMVGGDNGFIAISTGSSLSNWTRVGVSTLNFTSVPETAQPISFNNRVNDIVYLEDNNIFVGVASQGRIFTYKPQDVYGNTSIIRNSPTQNNLNSLIVDNVYDVGENSFKNQFIAVGDLATILVSATTIDNVSIGNPGVVWRVAMSESTGSTGLSGEKLNDIVHTGITTIPFIVVGNNGLILTFPDNKFNAGSFFKVNPAPTSDNFVSITYDPISETAVAVGSSGSIYTSERFDSFKVWTQRSSGITSNITDVSRFIPTNKYVALSENITLVSVEERVGAAATALVSSSGIITSIVVTNGGKDYGSTPKVIIDPPELVKERIKSCKVLGDHGTIVGIATSTSGIGTSSPSLIFNLKVDDSFVNSGLSTGDYYTLHSTNVGNGITSILSTGEIIGITTEFLDCVYRADSVENDQVSGIVTVTSNVLSIDNVGSIGTGIYGNYSWGKIYDFDGRSEPFSFKAQTLNGILGLSTSAKAIRLTSIGTTYVPDEF